MHVRDAVDAVNKALTGIGSLAARGNELVLRLEAGGICHLPVLEKPTLSRSNLLSVIRQAAAGGNAVLVTEYVTRGLGEELRDAGTNFLDCAGNVHLRHGNVLVYMVGRPRHAAVARKSRAARALQPTGLKLIYEAMMHDPQWVALPYRNLAAQAEISLGSVGWILESLRELGFLVELGGKRRLTDRVRLLSEWSTAYRRVLRPKCLIGRYHARDSEWWREAALPEGTALGGEAGAWILTGILRPEIITLYCEGSANHLLAANRLAADPSGEVEILEAFWPGGPKERTVPPLLVYADLLTSGSSRNLEAAEGIFEQFLKTDLEGTP